MLLIKKPFITYKKTGLACPIGSSKTKQSFLDDSNIDKIIAKYQTNQSIDFLKSELATRYGDTTSQDYKESLDLIKNAQSMFQMLPSNIRTKFNNDPHQYLEFTSDSKNHQEMFDLGLSNSPPFVEDVTEAPEVEAKPNPPALEK
jgi:phage internal scaffolding protein